MVVPPPLSLLEPEPHDVFVISGETRNSWIPADFNAALSESLACLYGTPWLWPATCTPSWSIVTGTPPIEAEATETTTLSVGVLPSFVIVAET